MDVAASRSRSSWWPAMRRSVLSAEPTLQRPNVVPANGWNWPDYACGPGGLVIALPSHFEPRAQLHLKARLCTPFTSREHLPRRLGRPGRIAGFACLRGCQDNQTPPTYRNFPDTGAADRFDHAEPRLFRRTARDPLLPLTPDRFRVSFQSTADIERLVTAGK